MAWGTGVEVEELSYRRLVASVKDNTGLDVGRSARTWRCAREVMGEVSRLTASFRLYNKMGMPYAEIRCEILS